MCRDDSFGEDEVDPAEEARMWEAVREGDQGAIHELLVGDDECPPCGLSVDCKDAAGMTPLHWLTVEGHASVTQWLIDEVGAKVDEPDARYGQSALHFAAAKGMATVTVLLLHRGADPVKRDSMGWTPLHAAARAGHVDVMASLLGALSPEQIDLAGPCGCTALHRAAYWGHADVR
jgi:ankyrin repeat protein